MYLFPVLFTFYLECVLKLKKNNSGSKRLINIINIKLSKFHVVLYFMVSSHRPNDRYEILFAIHP